MPEERSRAVEVLVVQGAASPYAPSINREVGSAFAAVAIVGLLFFVLVRLF